MTIIEKYMPLNEMGKIKSLIDELKGIPGAMNTTLRQEIFQHINKVKLQIKFQEEYPEALFTDPGCLIPNIGNNDKTSSGAPSKQDTPDIEAEQENQITYLPRETMGEIKSVYGTYIEMAFHNFYLTMHHIYAVVFGEDIMEEAKKRFDDYNTNPTKHFSYDFANEQFIWNPMFERAGGARPEQKELFEKLVIKHFPFLKAIEALEKRSRKTKIQALRIFSLIIRELRNIYSHYRFCPFENQVDKYKKNLPFVLDLMEILYAGAQREVKGRFGFDDKKMQCAQKYEPNKDHSLRDKQGRFIKAVPKKNFRYHLQKNEDGEEIITPFGLVFLTSLFLEKKYAKILSDKTHCIRYTDQEVLCEMISVYRIRLHIQKLNVTKDTDALALDIINELQRCPKRLFEMLPPDEQQQFRIKPTSSQSSEDVLMIRHQDRFAHLLLKYIDDAHLFDRIRFQVSLGRYFFRFYDKSCIDSTGDKRVRAICKDINGFGRITDIETYRKEVYGDMVREYEDVHANTSQEKPYITDHHAKYLISSNRIGLYIRKEDDTQCLLPELTPDGARNVVPTCWLSIYELPALAFLLHLYSGNGTRVEEIIQTKVAYYQRLFADVRDGKICPVKDEAELVAILQEYGGMKPSQLPRKLLDYLLQKDVCAQDLFNTWAQSKLRQMIDQTDRLLQNLEKDLQAVSDIKQNKFGKKSFVAIKPGNIANFLAHDMMFFQPSMEGGSNKLTGLNFRILQSSMAVYDGDFEELSRIMRSAHIIGNANDAYCNPIVMAVCRKYKEFSSIIRFYQAYLKERKAYLQQCANEGRYDTLSFLYASRNKWKERSQAYYRSLAAKYLVDDYGGVESTKAIELPRGLFEPYIRQELSEIGGTKSMAGDATKNMSYLIYGYFRQVMCEDTQAFYSARRGYQLFNVLYRKSPHDSQCYYSTTQIREMLMRNHPKSIRKDIDNYVSRTTATERTKEKERCEALLRKLKDTETALKVYKTQDMLLFLIAKRLLLDRKVENDSAVQMNAINQIHLKNIADGNTLSQKIPINVSITLRNGVTKIIKQEDLKLKNYSQFYSIISDRRLPSLLDLINSQIIMRSDIENELSNYDKSHPHVLKSVFEFEKLYFETYPISPDTANTGIPNTGEMLKKSNLSAEIQEEVRKIRNSFAHLSYPGRKVAGAASTELPKKAETISNKLIEHLNKAEIK